MYLSFDHFCRFFHNVHFGFSLFLVEDHVADQEGVLTLDHLGASGIFDIGEFFQWDLGAGGCRNQDCKNKVIDFMPGQSDNIDKGGTLRLGAYPCVIKPGTTMERCYGKSEISERHRHRYEFNNDYRDILTQNGLTLSGLSPDGRLVETVEISDRPFYVGVQYHPEFKSRPNKAHPLFKGFIAAALEKSEIGE